MDPDPADTAASVPWASIEIFPESPPQGEYGYLSGKKLQHCSREELIEACSKDLVPAVHLVWTPQSPRLQPPCDIPFLFDALKLRAKRRFRSSLVVGLFGLLTFGFWFLLAYGRKEAPLFLILALISGVLPVAQSIRNLRSLRSLTPEAMAGGSMAVRYTAWLATRSTALTWALAVCLTIVGAAQCWAGGARSVAAAGLVKPAVWNGEAWRLLTGTLLHGNVLHFLFNLTALFSLGRAVEGLASRYHLATVFLVSALSGSVFSLILLPNVPSVGASGGLLGLIGFLAVVGWRRRAVLGSAFLRSLLLSILLIALMGATAWQFIDNAAHLGGLLGGVLCGLALVAENSSIPLAPGRPLRWLGLASAAGCFAAAAFSVFRMV